MNQISNFTSNRTMAPAAKTARRFMPTMRAFMLSLGMLSAGTVVTGAIAPSQANAQKNVFQTGEELVYNVSFGFIKLGTVVIRTGGAASEYGQNKVSTSMKFWTADVPFLNAKSDVKTVIDTKEGYLIYFSEKSDKGSKHFQYDKAARTLTYNDATVKDKVTNDINPFNDALSLVFNMRKWSGTGKTYSFLMRGRDGESKVVCKFTKKTSKEEVEAFDDKEVVANIVEGNADMGGDGPLGADGTFKAYMTNDAAAIPVKIEMSIAIGSITLELAKIKRSGYDLAKN